jgi:tetratricopeptide (TPR) repeat protein
MKRSFALVLVVSLSLTINRPIQGAAPPSAKAPFAELNQAQRAGWQLALLIIEKLEAGDQKGFPGIRAWLDDFRKATRGIDLKTAPDKWPAFDVDRLLSRNANFWRACYEIAPGDPGLLLLHAGLLLSAGEATRASHLVVVARQRPGIPKELRQGFQHLLRHAGKVTEKPNALIEQGIKLHDKGDYAAALRKYRDALALWPQNSFAHYEMGLSLYFQQLIAAGEKVPKANAVIVNRGTKPALAVAAAFTKARRHDPFQLHAYQGADKEVLRALQVLLKKAMPAWQKLLKARDKQQVEDEVLQQFAAGCQEGGVHELALVARQVLVARRGSGYAPADHPFITTSLRKLAPGPKIEAVLERLAGGKLTLRQLVVPERSAADAADKAKVVALHQLRLYVPTRELSKRIGDDVDPLVKYIKALERSASRCLEKEKLPGAKGLLIAVGIKPDKKSRVWCQSVEGEIPAEVLRKLEKELAKVKPIAVKGVMAFGMEAKVRGQEVEKFPAFPTVWLEAAKRAKTKLLVPPDELFKVIWAD